METMIHIKWHIFLLSISWNNTCSILICWVLDDLVFCFQIEEKLYIIEKPSLFFNTFFSQLFFRLPCYVICIFYDKQKRIFFYKTHFIISVIWHVNLKIRAWKSFLVETLRFCFKNFLIKTIVLLSTLLKINSRLFYHKPNFDV